MAVCNFFVCFLGIGTGEIYIKCFVNDISSNETQIEDCIYYNTGLTKDLTNFNDVYNNITANNGIIIPKQNSLYIFKQLINKDYVLTFDHIRNKNSNYPWSIGYYSSNTATNKAYDYFECYSGVNNNYWGVFGTNYTSLADETSFKIITTSEKGALYANNVLIGETTNDLTEKYVGWYGDNNISYTIKNIKIKKL